MVLNWQQLMDAADEVGIKLEMVQGVPTWEAWPASRHQITLQKVANSLRCSPNRDSGCGCSGIQDVYVRFPDGSIKRPDLSIFCVEPPIQDETLEIVPDAVVEIVSKGYEKKDLETGPPFYLSQGVKDVVVVNPYDGKVYYHTADGTRELASPTKIVLTCGCSLDA